VVIVVFFFSQALKHTTAEWKIFGLAEFAVFAFRTWKAFCACSAILKKNNFSFDSADRIHGLLDYIICSF
jgi:hypothetical protein